MDFIDDVFCIDNSVFTRTLTQFSSDINILGSPETKKTSISTALNCYTSANISGQVQRDSAKLFKPTFNTNSDSNSNNSNNINTSTSTNNTSNVLSALYLQLPVRLARVRSIELDGISTTDGDLDTSSDLADLREKRMVIFNSGPVPNVSSTPTPSNHDGTDGTPGTPNSNLPTFPDHSANAPSSSFSATQHSRAERRMDLGEKEEAASSGDSGGTAHRHARSALSRRTRSVEKFAVLSGSRVASESQTPGQTGATKA